MIGTTFQALLSHWWHNKLQLFTLLAGLALATALWSGVQAINAEARASYAAASNTLDQGQFDQLRRDDGGLIDHAIYVALRRAGWLVSPIVEGEVAGQRLIGIEPLTAPPALRPFDLTETEQMQDAVTGADVVFAHPRTLADIQNQLPVTGFPTETLSPGLAIADIGLAQRLIGKSGQFDALIVLQGQPIRQALLADIAPDLLLTKAQSGTDVARLTDSFHLNLSAFGLLSFAVGLFIVNGAIGLAFEQRRPVIRTLRAIGVPLNTLIALMVLELLALSLLAGAIGVMLGYLVASALLPDVAATLRGLYGAEVAGTLQLRPIWWLSGLAIAVGGALAAALRAFWQLARMPILAGTHRRALALATGRTAFVQGVVAVALLAAACALALFGTGLAAGFALLGTLLLGAALLLPVVLDRIIAFAENRAANVIPQWFWADSRQQLPGLSLALMALLLAMAANVGVSTMVSSFRVTFTAFLDQRLSSELYVAAETVEQGQEIVAFVTPRVDAVLPIQFVDRDIFGHPSEVYGSRDHATFRDNWRFLEATETPWDAVRDGKGILINEQLARRSGIWTGGLINLDGAALEIVGVYGDYGNPIGQAVINENLFALLFPETQPTRFGLRMAAEDVTPLMDDLNARFELPSETLINQAGIKAFSLGIFERTFTVTGALNVLTLSVAGFAILMSLLTLATMRVPQLAPVWAMGLTRRSIGQIELLRAVLFAALTALIALPLGLVLAWVLLNVVNVAAFGWQLPMHVFPLEYLKLGLLALVAAIVAALWPAWRLANTPPSDLLKVFANER